VILLVSILAWAALYYPRPASIAASFALRRAPLESSLADLAPVDATHAAIRFRRVEAELAQLHDEQEAAYQRQSVLARLGRAIEPAVRPLGWDWRIGAAILASFPQREAVVATLGVIFSSPDASAASENTLDAAGNDAVGDRPAGDDDASLRARLRAATWEGTDRPLFTLPAALSIMVFYALCVQCVATLAVIRRETGGWRWPAFTFVYLTTAAYLGALLTYQLGTWIAR
jgi:ferrous iron transport protein B